MAGALKGITIEFGGDTTKLGKALNGVKAQSASVQTELRGINTMLKNINPNSTVLLAQKQAVLGNAITESTAKLRMLKQTQNDIDSGKVKATSEQYRDLQREILHTQAQLKAYLVEQRSIATGAVQLQNLGKEWQTMGAKITEVGQKFMPLTIAIAAVGAASVAASIKFESSFAGVRKTVNATEEEFQKLKEASRQMALNKPVDVNDVNRVMELGGQLGIATDNLEQFAGVVSDLDVATDLDVDTASTEMAQFANITGMTQDQFDRFGATLVALGNNSATTESSIMNMAMRIAGAGTQVGMTQSDILGLSAALSSVGIEAESGGTAISTVMSQIDKDVAMNSDNLKTWADTAGMSVDEFSRLWGTDATAALEAVFKGMGDARAGGENLNIILDELGVTSLRQTDMMKRMSNASDLLTSSVGTASSAWSENTALQTEVERKYATTESQLIMLKNRIIDAGISIGDGLKPALVSLMQALTPVVEGIGNAATAFSEMSPEGQKVVMTVAGMAAGFAPLMIVTGKMTTGAGHLVESLGKMSAAFAAKAVASGVDTAATEANTAASNKAIITAGLKGLKDNIAAATAARKAAATTADTASTLANTAATTANTAATTAGGAASGASAIKSFALTVAHGAQTVASNAATVGQMALNAAMEANPIGAVIMLVGGLVAVMAGLALAMRAAAGDTNDYTKATQDNKAAVDEAQATYDKAVESQGENSDAALKAKAALDEETAAYENSKETIGEFNDRCKETLDSHDQLMDSVRKSSEDANAEAGSILYLADQVTNLSSQEGKSAEDKARLSALVDSLNGSCEGLNLTYDEQNDKLSMNADAINAVAQATANKARAEAAQQTYNDLIKEQMTLETQLSEAQENKAATQGDLNDATDGFTKSMGQGLLSGVPWVGFLKTWADGDLDTLLSQKDLNEEITNTSAALVENKNQQTKALEISARYAQKNDVLSKAAKEVADGTLTAEQAQAKYNGAVDGGITVDEVAAQVAFDSAQAESQKAEALSKATEAVQAYVDANSGFDDILAANGYTVDSFAQKLEDSGVSMDDLAREIDSCADTTANAFDKIKINSDVSLDGMLETLRYNTDATNNWSKNITALYAKCGSDSEREYVSYLASTGVENAAAVQALVDDTEGYLGELGPAYGDSLDAANIMALGKLGLLREGYVDELGQLTDEGKAAVEENADAIAEVGGATGEGYAANLTDAIAQCPAQVQQYIQQLEGQLSSEQVQAAQAGTATGEGYSNSLTDAISQCPSQVQQYIQQLESQLDSTQVEAARAGLDAGTSFSDNTADGIDNGNGAVGTAASGLQSTAGNNVSGMGGVGSTAGTSLGSMMQRTISGYQGSVGGAAGGLQGAAGNNVSGMGGIGQRAGSSLGNMMAGGMNGSRGGVSGAASGLSNAAQGARNYGNPYSWGSDLGSQLASGISSMLGTVTSAASSLASAISSHLHFSVPDEGPLADFDTYMPDMVDLLVAGMESGEGSVANAASQLAEKMRNGFSDPFSIQAGISTTFGAAGGASTFASDTAKRLDAVVSALESMNEKLNPEYQVVLDTGVLAGSMTKKMDKNLGDLQRRRATF